MKPAPIRGKCHPVVLALMFCTTERCTYFQSTLVTRLVCRGRWSSVWWAGSCIMFPHQLMMFDEHTYLCLHWCYAHLSAVQELGTYAAEVPVHISHMELGCAAYSIISWWCFLSRISQSPVTIRSKCHQFVLALMFSTFVFCTLFQSISVTRLVCRVRWSSGWWAWICILFHHQLMMFDEHTQLCLHWCYARLSAVLKLSTSAAVVPVHISHKVCILSWSCDWWSGMRSIFIINWWCSMTYDHRTTDNICCLCQQTDNICCLCQQPP